MNLNWLRTLEDTFSLDGAQMIIFYVDFYREVGNLRASRSRFNHSLALNPYHVLTLQLRGDMLYHSGEPYEAMQDFKV